MRIEVDLPAFIFASIENAFILPTVNIKAGAKLDLQPLPIACMFNISIVYINNVKAGFHFTSRFTTNNHGSCLVTYLQNKKLAEAPPEVLLKSQELVVYHFPNRGTLAISPSVSDLVQSIFEDQ